MSFELMAAGFDEQWVYDLAPSQLHHYHGELVRNRAARQREQLHIQVAAAAVTADGGKAYKAVDSALAVESKHRTVGGKHPSGKAEARQSLDELAEIKRRNAETDHLWKGSA